MPGASVTRHPGFIEGNSSGQGALGLGGLCVQLEAAGALKVGDAVYISAADTVDAGKVANEAAAVGVVVGGVLTGYRTQPEVAVGTPAADTAGQIVLVAISGVVEAVSDAALTLGDQVTLGTTTAGRVLTTASTDFIGYALATAGAAGVTIRVLLKH